jgi:hypothetical protein
VRADPEFAGNFVIFQSLRNQLDDSPLPPAELPCSIQQSLLDRQFLPPSDGI